MRAFVRFACLAFVVVAVTATIRSQSALPTRLLQQGDLVHLGSFTVPDVKDTQGNYGFEYTQGVIAFNSANNSLFVVGHDWDQEVAEVSIPSLGGQATMLQGFHDALNGRITAINPTDPNAKKIGGMYVSGDQLIIAAYSYYDGANSAVASHFVRSTNLSSGTAQGPIQVGNVGVAFTAGYFGPVPPEWQTALGGPVLNGQCCLAIISRTSYGPAVFAIDPSDVLALKNPAPAQPLVYYPEAHQTLAGWASTGPLFNGTTIMRGVLLPAGTATVLFFGRHGMGPFCYGDPVTCKDPDDSGKGTHAYPYEPHVWAYNANDLAAVRAGAKQPWDVKPYATWRLDGLAGANIGGVTEDPATGRIFVTENFGDGVKPRIHVFTVNGSTTTSPPADTTAPAVAITAPTDGATVSGTLAVAATASDNVGVSSVWLTVDGVTAGTETSAAPYQLSWNSAAVTDGNHALRAVARDAAGNTATSAAVTVSVANQTPPPVVSPPGDTPPPADTTAPSVTVTAPAASTTVNGTVAVDADASDNVGVASVQFTLDGVALGTADASAPFASRWDTTRATDGTHVLRAVAADQAGNIRTSAPVSVTVQNGRTGWGGGRRSPRRWRR